LYKYTNIRLKEAKKRTVFGKNHKQVPADGIWRDVGRIGSEVR
jgi:hypothetical protein